MSNSERTANLSTIASVARLLAVVVTVAALYFARDVFIPLALGTLLSFLLSPIVYRLRRAGIPNVFSVVATAAFAFVLLAAGFTLIGRELTTLVGEFPKYKHELVAKARGVAGLTTDMGGSLDALAEEVTEAIEGEASAANESSRTALQRWTDKLFPTAKATSKPHDGTTRRTPLYIKQVGDDVPLASWAATAGTVLGPLATAGLVSVFALFILVHRDDLRDRIIAIVSHGNYVATTEAIDEVGQRISRYLVAQSIVNTAYGFVLAAGLFTIGASMTQSGEFPNAILWGVLATCLRFVPYLGPIVAAAFPLTIAASVFPGYAPFVAVLSLIVTMELLSNNIFEPWFYGTSTGISAVAVIIAAVFWSWLWGPVGLLLSTPLTVCLVVLGRHVQQFKMFSMLLGEEVAIRPSLRFYQRLLADDKLRAAEMLNEYSSDENIDRVCDEVIVPTLKRIRADVDVEQLSDVDAERRYVLLDELLSESSLHATHENEESTELRPTVIGCIAHQASESMVLDQLHASSGDAWSLLTVDAEALPQELAQQIAEQNPVAVVIVVLPPGGFAQARFLCKSIRGAGYRGSVVIACMGKFKNFDKLFVKFRKAGATCMTTTFSQTRAKLNSLVRRQTHKTNTFERPQVNADDASLQTN